MTTTFRAPLTRRAFVGIAAGLAIVTSTPTWTANAPLQIWFIRHGESEINIAGGPRPVPDNGMSYPLTRRGVEQARTLAAALSETPITQIYTSTSLRAVQTADALAFDHTLTLSLAPEAAEIDFGVAPDADMRFIYIELARKWLMEKNLDARNGNGESLSQVQKRFVPFVREVINRHAQDGGVVVIVAHSATLGFMVPMLASNVPSDFALRHPLPNTGIIKTELRGGGKLFCTEWTNIPYQRFDE